MSEEDRLADKGERNRTVTGGDSSAFGVAVVKSCCVCHADLHGKTRYKDSSGRYWCPVCNERDQLAKKAADCPDCNKTFTQADLVDFKGVPVCQVCWDKRRTSARREESRLRALEAQLEAEEKQRKRWKLIISVALGMIALWAVLYAIIWLLGRVG